MNLALTDLYFHVTALTDLLLGTNLFLSVMTSFRRQVIFNWLQILLWLDSDWPGRAIRLAIKSVNQPLCRYLFPPSSLLTVFGILKNSRQSRFRSLYTVSERLYSMSEITYASFSTPPHGVQMYLRVWVHCFPFPSFGRKF